MSIGKEKWHVNCERQEIKKKQMLFYGVELRNEKKNGRRKRRSMCYPQEYREVNVYYIGREDYSNGPDSFFSFLSAVCTFVYFLRPNPIRVENDTQFYFSLSFTIPVFFIRRRCDRAIQGRALTSCSHEFKDTPF